MYPLLRGRWRGRPDKSVPLFPLFLGGLPFINKCQPTTPRSAPRGLALNLWAFANKKNLRPPILAAFDAGNII
ncbi:MAG: hypothetical protein CM15mP55_2310 [Hyphomicrobiales bacterium]|nr:MAG: hypothetical protein CM15mP55_2310 [Hyphomicrobiales bacterium]